MGNTNNMFSIDDIFDGIREIKYCDYIEIIDDKDNTSVYDVYSVCNPEFALYLKEEAGDYIKKLEIKDSKLIVHYANGNELKINNKIQTINIYDLRLKRRYKIGICGTLLQYDLSMALKYGLNTKTAVEIIGSQNEEQIEERPKTKIRRP